MIREDDSFYSAEGGYRSGYANKLNADLYISIHGNTFDDKSVSGTESYYFREGSEAFAKSIHEQVVNATGLSDRGVIQEDYYILRGTTMPSVLLEIGYLTNPQDEQKMLTKDFQKSVAMSILDGVKEYLEIK